MSTESRRKVPHSELEADITHEHPQDINTVTVVFADGGVENFSLVVRGESGDWIYAERCVDISDEFVEEKVVSLRASAIRQIESDRIHLFEDGVLHYGDAYLVDPVTILEDSWLESDECIL